ncbi:MAG: tyrosine-type recombinase/integrase [Deltaproteobacteria bacterium]|nr:tyrosine-type recombinase/integrase [Deltaproteobacteria bacterium]
MTSIRTAFEMAKEKAGIGDLRLHDLRHTCITKWAMQGIAQQAIMAAAGHHSIQQSNAYVNMKDEHLKAAFKSSTPVIQGNALDVAQAASY